MNEARILRIYLDDVMLDMARAGTFGFVARVQKAFEGVGFRVDLRRNSFDERMKSGARPGYSLFLMEDPFHAKSLSMRKAYYFPFWRIEATAERWEFEVAKTAFDPAKIDPIQAQNWVTNWRKWLFKDGPARRETTGLLYVALQGKLLEHRSFQSMSPMNMIAEVQARAGHRKILLGLHPGEVYSDAERAALDGIAAADSRVQIQSGGMEEALRVCDFVITQNSAAALSGYFFEKPAILFGKSDFHHAMASVPDIGVDAAWDAVETAAPDFAEYLYWFVQLNSIKADEEGMAEQRILATCARHGWQI